MHLWPLIQSQSNSLPHSNYSVPPSPFAHVDLQQCLGQVLEPRGALRQAPTWQAQGGSIKAGPDKVTEGGMYAGGAMHALDIVIRSTHA